MSRSEIMSKNSTNVAAPLASFDEIETNTKSKKISGCESDGGSNGSSNEAFEYKGYYRFGSVLGKGSFGTVVECFRKSDDRPIALKFFQHNAIHKWIAESTVRDYIEPKLLLESEFFHASNETDRPLPSEVACLLRAHTIPGVIKILDYIPAEEVVSSSSSSSGSSGVSSGHENDDDTLIGIVLERDPQEVCLFDYLVKNNTLSEGEARVIMKQLVEINLDLLQHGILHGDLKSENILINPETSKIKLIDFGSAQIIVDSHAHSPSRKDSKSNATANSFHKCNTQSSLTKLVRTFRGTNLYKPPEYILHRCFYPRPSTVWTLGIILYDLVCGRFPFDKDADVLTHQDKEIDFGSDSTQLSENLKDLIKRCLAFYVADRIVIEKILSHPWMRD
jgi:serine/threonine protein kinase